MRPDASMPLRGTRKVTARAHGAIGAASADVRRPAWRDRLRAAWPRLKRVLAIGFMLLVLGLIAEQARTVDWPAVLRALRDIPAGVLALGGALSAACFAVYASYDVIGVRLAAAPIARWRAAATGVVSYILNLNLGSLVGGIAVRFRLYGRAGLRADTVAHVLAASLATNWLGYLARGGALFLLRPPTLPPSWAIDGEGLRLLGGALALAAVAYLAACGWTRRGGRAARRWTIRGHAFELPTLRIALMQLCASALNWALIGAVVWTLLQHRIDYASVLTAMLVAAVAGVLTHVPAGLGVLEAVVVALLSHRLPAGELLGALLAYRAVYYLGPLALAVPAFFALDAMRVTQDDS